MISANLLIALRKTLEEKVTRSSEWSLSGTPPLPHAPDRDPSERIPKTQGRGQLTHLNTCSHGRPGDTFAVQGPQDHLFDFL